MRRNGSKGMYHDEAYPPGRDQKVKCSRLGGGRGGKEAELPFLPRADDEDELGIMAVILLQSLPNFSATQPNSRLGPVALLLRRAASKI